MQENTIRLSVNPVFVEFYDTNKLLIDKSPNLKNSNINLLENVKNNTFTDTKLNGIPIRQIQTPIINKDKIVGYLVVAMSLEDLKLCKY